MVVKSSLWRKTRHRRGRAVRVFFSVATAVSPPSRGFLLGMPPDRTAAPGVLKVAARRAASGRTFRRQAAVLWSAHACQRDRHPGGVRAAHELRLLPARAGAPVRGLQTGGAGQGDPLRRVAHGRHRMPRAGGGERQSAGHPVPRWKRGVALPGALVQSGPSRVRLRARVAVRLGLGRRGDSRRSLPVVPDRRRDRHPLDRIRRAGRHAAPGGALPHRRAARDPLPRRCCAGPAVRSRPRHPRPRLARGGALCYKARAMSTDAKIEAELQRIEKGGAPKYHQKNAEQGKLFAREPVPLLLDEGSFVEFCAVATATDPELPADGVVTGLGRISGRLVALMANDSTVKAGSWGRRTVEKIVRIQEQALKLRCPMVYLVDSAGARITDQLEMFPGRRGAGRIFHLQCQLSGLVPQVCLLFGPSAAGGAYIPAFCDVVVMVEGNASMYLGSPRMAEMVIGEKVTLEELGGARMHCTESGCGDILVADDRAAIEAALAYLAYLPQRAGERPADAEPRPARDPGRPLAELIPAEPNRGYDMRKLVEALVDEGSWFELKKLFAKELLIGFARLDGMAVGVVA